MLLSVALLMICIICIWSLKVAGVYRQFEYWPENPLNDPSHREMIRKYGREETLRRVRRRVVASVTIGPVLIMLYLIGYAFWGDPSTQFGLVMLIVPVLLVLLQFRSVVLVWAKARQFGNNNPSLYERTGVAFDKKARPSRIKV